MTFRYRQSQRRSRQVLLLLLPLLALRLLVPAGFMVMADTGGLSIGLCSGFAPAPADSPHGAGHAMQHMHHGAGHGGSPERPEGYSHTPCLFASAAGSALPPQADLPPPDTGIAWRVLLPVQPAVVAAASIYRAQTARGPPVLA